jgi:hypothetical protein
MRRLFSQKACDMQAEGQESGRTTMPDARPDLDRFDLAILRVLQTEGRIPAVELRSRLITSK